MSQLAAMAQQQTGQTSPHTANTSNPPLTEVSSSHDPELDSTETDIEALLDAANDPSHGVYPPTHSALEGQPSIVDRGLVSEAEAERLLATFQRQLVPKFPFVMLAHGETAARLRVREPFLFLCVVAATIGSAHALCKTVAEEIMKHVTVRFVTRSERNLELLRGLLVHSAWYSYPAERYHPRLLLLVQFCISTLYDLGLHKKPCLSPDEQRALLGTYWLSVGVCGTLNRPHTLKHDGRTDDCLDSVASTRHASDRWIAPFIQLASFLATIDEVYASIQASEGRMLVQVTRGSLRRQFNSVKARIEEKLPSYPASTSIAIRTEIQFAELRLEQLSLREELWLAEPANAVRLTMLMDIIQRSKELIRTISSLPASEIAVLTITTSAHICAAVGYLPTAVLALLRLISHGPADPAIEAQIQAVVDAAEYPSVVTELANALETRLGYMSAAEKEADILGSLCSKMRLLARCYPYQIRAIVGAVLSQTTSQGAASVAAGHANAAITTPQVWPSIYGDLDGMFPVDDTQWESLLSSFTAFG
ncbi:fungal specific transcription factor domain-containing protein [Aspergillus saccharolyticus JOP 1030-1]|uniref:Transcription factor domain-containing protein n=1 Tax=Aspergillus saccharolyticus JOP 1030-1 TaxID=1450539 RepID=A0A318ZXI7_9EURO|nr:hypothetical protein BP01DRAFT_388853 [Aspergillus saccharolyticus JOP 1030-1]PYH49023.1 hypothetical protein BP01DRAFT_388853 [Aspergillus saccharolyticus JOP 1030-1]